MYRKLLAIHNNQKIDTLLVSIAPNNLFNNNLIEEYGLSSRGRYLPILSNEEKEILFKAQLFIFIKEIIKLGLIE